MIHNILLISCRVTRDDVDYGVPILVVDEHCWTID